MAERIWPRTAVASWGDRGKPLVSVRLYVEGGGDHNKALQTLCRRGFSEFVAKSGLRNRMPRVVACGHRQQAFESFQTAHAEVDATRPPVLLVDSEGAVH